MGSRLWRNKCDKIWRELVFAQEGKKCAICGDTEFLNAHHLIPRELLVYRHDLRNSVLLCPIHHKYGFLLSAHRNPVRFMLWLMRTRPVTWKWLSETFDPAVGVNLGDGHPSVNYKETFEALSKLNSSGDS